MSVAPTAAWKAVHSADGRAVPTVESMAVNSVGKTADSKDKHLGES